MIDFKGFFIPLISLGFPLEGPENFSTDAALCQAISACAACAGLMLSATRAITQRPAYVLAPGYSVYTVRAGRKRLALQVPAPGISGPLCAASVLDKRWHLCYNIPWQIGWHLGWQIGWHLVRQSACRISSIYNRHSPLSDIHV